MTRKDSVRAVAGSAKESARHAAEVMGPYADEAKHTAAQYAHEAGARLKPKLSSAARQARHSARDGYVTHLGPRLESARESLPPELDRAATQAARRTRKAARKASHYANEATEYARPRLESAVADARAAAGPARAEAAQRGTAALAALRGEVTPEEVEHVLRRRHRRARRVKAAKRLTVLGVLAGGAYAAWRWWDRQANPDWLVEPPPATEVAAVSAATPVNGSSPDSAAERPDARTEQNTTGQETDGDREP